jgi:hypothetical protein
MAKFTDKISNLINSQAPDFVLEQHPKFLEFIKAYYTFMESAELSITSIQTTDGIFLETETNQENVLLLNSTRVGSERTLEDEGDKILLESSVFGKFTRGETITGQTSKATATILGEDLVNGRLFISAQDKFIVGETVLGSSSNASGIINNYKPNPVENIQDLLNFRDPDKVISNFLTKFRNEFLSTLPEQLDSNVNKRTLIKNIKSLYKGKGTADAHKVFFNLLFDEPSETTYPRESILRASDGNWGIENILRSIDSEGDSTDLIGRTITGQTSGATAIPENVFKFQIGANLVTEFILNPETTNGTFIIGEEIRGTKTDEDDLFIKTIVTGIPTELSIINDGSLYSANDNVAITETGGESSNIQINGVGRGGIDTYVIENGGTGYEIGDDIIFNNTNTGGGNARAKVAVVNGGFTQEEATASNILLEDNSGSVILESSEDGRYTFVLEGNTEEGSIILEDGNYLVQEDSDLAAEEENIEYLLQDIENILEEHIVLENETVRGDPYTGNKIVQESGTGTGDITDIRIVSEGSSYISLPTVTVSDSSGGSGASVLAYGTQIGRVQSIKVVEYGAYFEQSPTPPTLVLPTNLILTNISGSGFLTGETVSALGADGSTTITATVSFFDNTRNLLKLSQASGTFGTDVTITGATTSTTANIKLFDQSTSSATIGALATTSGDFVNQDGFVSENTMRIHDNLIYQDYSYVIKIGRVINEWRDSFKKTMHSAGYYFTGQVTLQTQISAQISSPVDGIVSGESDDPIFSIINTLFTTIFGRRLGTEDDGTTLRVNPETGVDPLFDDSTNDFFTPNTRDLTLVHKMLIKLPIIEIPINFRGNDYNFGYAYCGPRLKSLNIYNKPFDSLYGGGKTLATYSAIESANPGYGVSPSVQAMTMAAWAEHRVTGLNNSLNGERFTIEDYGDSDHDNLKTFVAIPTEVIRINEIDTFDSNVDTFDSNTLRFDEG